MDSVNKDFQSLLRNIDKVNVAQAIRSMVDFSELHGEAKCDATLGCLAEFSAAQNQFKKVYHDYILNMEKVAVAEILAQPSPAKSSFSEMATPEALIAYQRMAGVFAQFDLNQCRTFTMVGCGPLPVTALQALERGTQVKVVALDVSTSAIASVNQLKRHYQLHRLEAQVYNGAEYHYGESDVIYVANMVSPKLATWHQIKLTARPSTIVIVREPYSLGRLWADSLEEALGDTAIITYRGPGSRYLSRDVIFNL